MDEQDALAKIGIGSTVIVSGFVVGAFLEYLVKVVLARFLGPESYGVFVQGYAVSSAAAILALFGFQQSIPRFMSYYRGKERESMIEKSTATALYMAIPFLLLFSGLIYFSAGWLSFSVFNEPSLVQVLELFSLTILPLGLFYLAIAFMRGMQNAKHKIVIDDLLMPGVELLLVVGFFIAGYGLFGAIYAYVTALAITVVVGYYLCRRISDQGLFSSSGFMTRKMLSFSWPLFLISVLLITNKWSDVLMLGWLMESLQVGVYEVSFAVAGVLGFVLSSLNYMFMPVVSELYGKDSISEIRRVYSTSTRWIFMLVLPILAGMLIFPKEILLLLFGSDYTTGAISLSILAVGFFYHVAVGPAGDILLSAGKTARFMAVTAVITGIDLLLNFLLIPRYGMEGAAVATTIGFIVGNTVYLWLIKQELGELPFNSEYLNPIVGIVLASGIIYGTKLVFSPGLLASVLLGAVLTLLYVLFLFVSGGIQEEDWEMFREILDLVFDFTP